MSPVISPSWFYWLDVVDTLTIINGIIFIISLVVMTIVAVAMFASLGEESEDYKTGKKVAKCMLAILIVSGLITIFAPCKETLVEMQIAKFATPDNAEWTVNAVKDVADYIIKAIKEIK